MGKLYVHLCAAAKVEAPGDPMPEQHRTYACNAKDQRKGEKIPLFAKKIYVYVVKELHLLLAPYLSITSEYSILTL